MKIAVLLLILPMALAAPTIESRDLPDMTPVTIKNLNPKFDVNCGKYISYLFSLYTSQLHFLPQPPSSLPFSPLFQSI